MDSEKPIGWDMKHHPMPVLNPRLYSFICLKPFQNEAIQTQHGEWAKTALSKHILLKHRLPAVMREPAVHNSLMGPAWRRKLSTTSDAVSGSAGIEAFGSPSLDWIPNLLWSVRLTLSQTLVLFIPREGKEEHLGMQQCREQELKQILPASDLEMIQCWHVPTAERLKPKNSW